MTHPFYSVITSVHVQVIVVADVSKSSVAKKSLLFCLCYNTTFKLYFYLQNSRLPLVEVMIRDSVIYRFISPLYDVVNLSCFRKFLIFILISNPKITSYRVRVVQTFSLTLNSTVRQKFFVVSRVGYGRFYRPLKIRFQGLYKSNESNG